jgi:hypothetical protein
VHVLVFNAFALSLMFTCHFFQFVQLVQSSNQRAEPRATRLHNARNLAFVPKKPYFTEHSKRHFLF